MFYVVATVKVIFRAKTSLDVSSLKENMFGLVQFLVIVSVK